MSAIINLDDFQRAAQAKLPKDIFDYYASGADDEISLHNNRSMFNHLHLLPRILVDISQVSTATKILGMNLNAPIMIAPTAFQGLAHPDGELATAKAAQNAGSVMIASTMANHRLEAIKQHSEQAWFQLYTYSDRSITENLVRRAEQAGYAAIVLTVDCPLMGNRENDKRNGFKLPPHCIAANFSDDLSDISYDSGESTVAVHTKNNFDQRFTWDDIQWLQSISALPIILKGILHPLDAELALQHNIAAIIVSNHGGRQIDTTPATIQILPTITQVIKGKIPVLMDGGIRRGTDIIKALSLGACAVLVGRPILWGLSIDGQQGVEKVLAILQQELQLNMALCGYTSVHTLQDAGTSVVYSARMDW